MPERAPAPNNPFDNAGPMDIGVAKDFAPTSMAEAVDAAVEDQKAYDQLGPLTRQAMKESAVRWSSSKMLEYVTMQRQRPSDPRMDRMLANMIKQHEPGIVKKMRVGDEIAVAAGERNHIERIVDRAMKGRKATG